MKVRKLIVVLAICIACAGAGVALAYSGGTRSASGDIETTQTYVMANYRLLGAIGGSYGSRMAAAQMLVRHIQSKCPNVLAAAPGGGEVFRPEAVAQLEYTMLLALRPAYLQFATVVGRLRWSSRELTQAVALRGAIMKAAVSIPQPDICSDAKEFVASGYQAAPSATKRFLAERKAVEDKQYMSRGGSPPENLTMKIDKLLLPYETPHERALVPPPAESPSHEQDFVAALDQLIRALGLPER